MICKDGMGGVTTALSITPIITKQALNKQILGIKILCWSVLFNDYI